MQKSAAAVSGWKSHPPRHPINAFARVAHAHCVCWGGGDLGGGGRIWGVKRRGGSGGKHLSDSRASRLPYSTCSGDSKL